jgi:hypothetical protein
MSAKSSQRRIFFTEGFGDSTELAECPELSRTVTKGKRTEGLENRWPSALRYLLFKNLLCASGPCYILSARLEPYLRGLGDLL